MKVRVNGTEHTLDVDPDMVSLVLDRFAEAAGVLDWASASSRHM